MGIYIFDTSGAYTALVGFGEDYGDPNGPITEAYRVLVQGMAPAPLEKYKKLGREYPMKTLEKHTQDELNNALNIMKSYGLQAKLNG